MAILSSELVAYGAASRPEDDVSAAGGAIDAANRPSLVQLTANSVIAVISDGADARTITIYGRNAAGVLVQEALVLNGAVEVVGATVFERIHRVVASAASGTRTVTVRQGAGGATRATLALNQTSASLMFIGASSAAAPTTRFEKFFWRNDNATLSLTSATVKLTADPDANVRIGVAASVNDTGSVADRQTSPGVTFVDDNVSQNVPGGALAAGSRIGVWVELALAANEPPLKTSFTTELAGQTT